MTLVTEAPDPLKPASSADTKPRALGQLPLPDWKGALGILTGAVYVTGFVTVNVHLSRLQSVDLELLRGRYLAAGLLFFLLSVPASVASWFAIRAADQRRAGLRASKRLLVYTFAVFPICMCSATVFLLGMFENLVDSGARSFWVPSASLSTISDTLPLFLLPAAVAATFLWLLFLNLRIGLRVARPARMGQGTMMVALILGVSASLFGRVAYSKVDPSFGGGAGRMADVLLKPESDHDQPSWISGLIFDEHDEGLSLLVCSSVDQMPATIRVPKEEILRVRYPLGRRSLVAATPDEAADVLKCRSPQSK